MTNKKISALTALTAPAASDVLPILDLSESADGDKNKKITYEDLLTNVPAGSTSTPSIAFSGDPDTGIAASGANGLQIVTGGSTRLTVSSAGLVTIAGDLTVSGTTTTVSSTTLTVADKNIEIAKGAANDAAADGAGLTVDAGSDTDKTWNWVDSTDSWTSSEHIDLASGKVLKVAGTQVLSATQYTGNAATATSVTNLTVAAESTDTSCSVLFTTAASGSLPPKSATTLTFNSNTGALTATSFVGALTGNVTGSCSGTAGSVTSAAQSTITSLGTLTGLTVSGNILMSGTGAIDVAAGTTGERPGSPNAGMIRFNTTDSKYEGYDGSGWGELGGGDITVQDEGSALSTAATTLNFVGAGVTASGTGATKTITISGSSGSGTADLLDIATSSGTGGGGSTFDGSRYRFKLVTKGTSTAVTPANAEILRVSINGIIQQPNDGTGQGDMTEGYVVDGTDIIFDSAPPSGATYFIINMGTTIAIGTPGDNTVDLAQLAHATQGDVIYWGSSGVPARLGAGTSGQYLKTQGSGANPTWADVDTTPTTTRGDIIYRGASADQRLAKGTSGQFLKIGANDPEWADVSSTPTTTRGDIIYRGASADERLAKGTSGQFLKIGANDPEWADVSSPMFQSGKVACFTHETGSSTGAGSFSSGAYNTVPFTHTRQALTGVTLSSNVITLGPGTYQMLCWHHLYMVDTFVFGLKITSASGDHYWGSGGSTGTGSDSMDLGQCWCRHVNDTGGDETMIAHARVQTTNSSYGLGKNNTFGAGNIYGMWWILKEA